MPKQNLKFSILMLTIPSRTDVCRTLIEKLENQIGDREDVEIINLMDNKSLHIFEKRNHLLDIARGEWLAFLDDDDDISDDYIDVIMKTLEENPNTDLVAFNQQCWLDGVSCRVFFDLNNPHENCIRISKTEYKDTKRPPYHMCVWRSSIAKSEIFKSAYSQTGQSCEDIDWLVRLYPKVREQTKIDDYLHIYRYDSELTESIVT